MDRTEKWYELYRENPAISPSDNPYADGYVYVEELGAALVEVALATENPDSFGTESVHIWADDRGFSFKMSESSWEGKQCFQE